MVRAGDKFIIEIESAYYPACAFTADDIGRSPSELMDKVNKLNFELYKIKGFNTLVFDENGLNKLDRFKGYEELYQEGEADGISATWDTARQIVEMSPADREYLFGYEDPKYILRVFEVHEAMEILANRNSDIDRLTDDILSTLRKSGKDVSSEQVKVFVERLPYGIGYDCTK